MSKKSKKQKTLEELHKEITKDIGIFDLPMRCKRDPNFKPEPHVETYEEWLEEMEYEESLMTQEEKDEAEKRSKEQFQMLKQILKQYHPERYIDTEIMCEHCLKHTTSYIVDMTIVTKLKDIDIEYRGKRAYCYQCDQEKHIDEIMQYNKEQCFKKFEGHQNYLDWDNIHPVGREI